MSSCHILINNDLLKRLKNDPCFHEIEILTELDFGDGNHVCLVKSNRLPPGYSGVREFSFDPDDNSKYKFTKDVDT